MLAGLFAMIAASALADGGPVTAMGVCAQLRDAGTTKSCRVHPMGAIDGTGADFDLVSGHHGDVSWYARDATFQQALRFVMAGVNRPNAPFFYANIPAHIIVIWNSQTPDDVSAKIRAVVDAL